MKKIYLIRHGETVFNLEGKIQGWCDSPLTENGINQAKIAGQYFKDSGIIFDKAYSSTLKRAEDTLGYITNVAHESLDELREWSFGKLEGKDSSLIFENTDKPRNIYLDNWRSDFDGENREEVQKRMHKAFDIMIASDAKTILAVSHGAAIYSFLISLPEIKENLDNYSFKKGIKNLEAFEFEINGCEIKFVKNHNPLEKRG